MPGESVLQFVVDEATNPMSEGCGKDGKIVHDSQMTKFRKPTCPRATACLKKHRFAA